MHSIHASQSGSITLVNTLVLEVKSHLRIVLNSKLVFNYQPILITSIKQPPRSPRSCSPTRPFKDCRKILRGDLQKKCPFQFHWVYDVVQHTIGKEGSYIFDLKCKQIGHHFVRIIWLDWDDQIVHQMGDPFNFIIENGINLRTLTIQTILPNLIDKWDFDGYDAYHLCPIQEVQDSLYSITDQLSLRGFKNIEELGDMIRNSKKIFFVDVVLNHTAPSSKWLDLEECVYNEKTVPQLKSALELDLSLEQVTCYDDIGKIVRNLKLEEYFELQEQQIGPIFLEDDDDNMFDDDPVNKCVRMLETKVINLGVERKGATIVHLGEVCAKFSRETIEQGIIVLNNKLRSQCQGYIEEAIINIQNYYKKENKIQRYFHKLNKYYAAYNGWIMDINPEEDFVTSSNFHYLRRTINHWHVIKLRYAKDTPLLYERMTKYIQQMASVFHGIRLDNAHSTKFSDLSYFIRKARKINPELIVFGEFFGLNEQQYLHYQSALGINAFVRELIYSNNTKQLAEILRNHKIYPHINPIQYLVYDQSHDNEPIIKKYGPHYLTSLVSALQFSDNFKGTNRMVDQFYPEHISCVFETRKYPQQYLQIKTIQKRLVRFTYNTPKENVILRGSFDEWQHDHQMNLVAKDLYEIYLLLDLGDYQFKFIVDGVWQCDGNQPILNDNNIRQIFPIECYQSLTFIRSIKLEYSRTYIEDENDYLIITKTNEDHQESEVIVICFNHVYQTIQMPSNILKLQYTYSYLQQEQTIETQNQLPNNLHLIDTTTQYAIITNNQKLQVNAPPSTVFILKLDINPIVHQIQQYLNSSLDYDISLLYRQSKQIYHIPDCGKLELSGLYGVYKYIKQIETNHHPLIRHLLSGDSLISYYISQLPEIEDILTLLTKLPTNYKPYFFIKVITKTIESIESKYTKIQEPFLRQLDILSKSFDLDNTKKGRELFMSLKGLVLLTGRLDQAKHQILRYAHYLKEGLIPNTLKPLRYNSRDTCFWWIKAIRDYVQVSEDYELFTGLQDKIFSIFQCHANGINMKEGYQSDFTDKDGLQIQLYMDSDTGMILGGNYKNGLTWMDTIGSSKINCGFPAASRDGAPVECTALLKLCLDFLHKMYQLQKFKFEGIKYMYRTITWKAWSDYLCQHFERCYWVPTDQTLFSKHNVQLKHLRRKGIYKDIYNCSKPRSEYQLRPNAAIAIALAPELFQKQHAAHYLALLEQYLISQKSLGVSTLDSIASEFSGKLIQEENDDFAKSKKFSLYNGSEFIFLLGYYLKALLKIHKNDINKTIFYAYLAQLKEHLLNEFTLPEYTDMNGQLLGYQNSMLSVALIQELIYDRQQLDQ